MTMRPSVAARLPGATQLMQLPTIVGVSYTDDLSLANKPLPTWPAISRIQSFMFGAVALDTVEPRPRTVRCQPFVRSRTAVAPDGAGREPCKRTALAREYTAADVDAALLVAPSSRWWRQAKWLIWAVLSNSSSSRIELAPATYGVIPQMTVSCKTVMSPSPHSLSKISKEVSKKIKKS
jgi:hypothetical protein